MDTNEDIAIQTQQKFEFYFLALVFTVLGLSIQTSVFSSKLQSIIEILAWGVFLISGLAGLSRMEWIPVSYKSHSDLTYEKSFVKEAKGGRSVVDESGRLQSNDEIKEWIQHAERRIKERTEKMDNIETWSKIKYFLHKWMFVAGLVLLVVSRAINLYSSQPTSLV
jgi:hypothetical protein